MLLVVGAAVSLGSSRSPVIVSPSPVSHSEVLATVPHAPLPTSEITAVVAPVEQTSEIEASASFNQFYLQQFMLDLINADRVDQGLSPVVWDDTAACAGQTHAEEMVTNNYLSHWDIEGNGPDYRYTRAGGLNAVQENVYSWRQCYDDGSAVPVSDWEAVIREAQAALMESSGHRRNILNPLHTHVGIGVAYNATNGEFRVAQEFIGRYIQLDPLPKQADLGGRLRVSGQVLVPVEEVLLNLAYEPFPTSMDVDVLNTTSMFQSPAQICDTMTMELSSDSRFSESLILDCQGQAGRYHVLLWVETSQGQALATDVLLDVR